MKKKIKNREDLPPDFYISRQWQEIREYNDVCRDMMLQMLPDVMSGFHQAAEDGTGWTYTLLGMNSRMIQQMERMRELMKMPSHLLCKEHLEAFGGVVCQVEEQARLMCEFAKSSHLLLQKKYETKQEKQLSTKCKDQKQEASEHGNCKQVAVFRKGVNEERMAEELRRVFEYFFGTEKHRKLKGKYSHEVDLAAILYILLKKNRLLNCTSEEGTGRSIAPFHQFLAERVWKIKATYRTLYNRLTRPEAYGEILEKFCAKNNGIVRSRQTGDEWENLYAVRDRMPANLHNAVLRSK